MIREFLAAHFLKIWGLKVPDFAIIDVDRRHIPDGLHARLTAYEFSRPAFGSLYVEDAEFVNESLSMASAYQVKIADPERDLVNLALFDLWLSNNDRNWNNHNLLIRSPPNVDVIPIDHERTFDHGSPGQPLTLQTSNENLSASAVFRRFVTRKFLTAYTRNMESQRTFKTYAAACSSAATAIIEQMPDEWKRLCPTLVPDLRATIFADQWLTNVWKTHLEYLQENYA